MRKEIARLVHHLDACLTVGDADVDVQAEDEQLADHVLQLVLQDLVALGLGDLLVLPVRERVCPGGGDAQTGGLEQRRERAAQLRDLVVRLADVGADLRARLDDRLHHLGLDLLAESRCGGGEEGRAVALQLPLPVDDLELLLDPDREARHVRLPHRRPPPMTYVGTTLPAPAVTFSNALEDTRARQPETAPQKRYGLWSMERSRKCILPRRTGNG